MKTRITKKEIREELLINNNEIDYYDGINSFTSTKEIGLICLKRNGIKCDIACGDNNYTQRDVINKIYEILNNNTYLTEQEIRTNKINNLI